VGLVPVLAVGVAVTAEAKPPRSTSAAATVERVNCLAGQPTGVTYSVVSSSATVDVEVRWRVRSTAIIQFGSTYVVYTYRGVTANTQRTDPAPTGYQLDEVTVAPITGAGRPAGTADSEPVSCSL
jgi:hypothetical protein